MYITVREFIQENPYISMDIMTEKGVVRLPAALAQNLLTKTNPSMKLKANSAGDTVLASEVLAYIIFKVIWYRKRYNYVFLLTKTSPAAAKSYYPQIEFQQLEFDLTDLPAQWLEDKINAEGGNNEQFCKLQSEQAESLSVHPSG